MDHHSPDADALAPKPGERAPPELRRADAAATYRRWLLRAFARFRNRIISRLLLLVDLCGRPAMALVHESRRLKEHERHVPAFHAVFDGDPDLEAVYARS
jgi:hypothetical protein